MIKIVFSIILFAFPVMAQTPTVVYGASEDAPGRPDQYLLIQPKDSPNPLGNPIVDSQPQQLVEDDNSSLATQNPAEPEANQQPSGGFDDSSTHPDSHSPIINQTAPQNPEPFSETPQQQEDQIQNSLYQGGNRIYDVQSYPIEDIKTITEPNVQPTITTYPEY